MKLPSLTDALGYPLFIMEGNVGAGKSTASKEIAKRLNLRRIEEPVDPVLLDMFYKDKDRWSFPFQIDALMNRWPIQISGAVETCMNAGYKGAMIDRGLFGDLVFATALAKAEKIHPIEYKIYLKAVRNMCLVLWPPTALIYLNASPETCLERVKKRNRPQEQDITLEYLQSIHRGYQDLIKSAKTGFFPWSHAVSVINVPWDVSTTTTEEWDRVASMVQDTIYSLGQ